MTPEEKAAADAASAEAKAAEEATKAEKEKADADFEAGLDGLSDEEKDQARAERNAEVDKHKIDYEAELKKEKDAREKAENALADKRFKDAEKRRKAAEEPDDEGDKPVTRKDLDAVKAEARREAQADRALEIAKGMSGSAVEAQLIVAKWENRTFPEGMPLSEQMEETYAIVHRKKLIGERDEALRALRGKDAANRNAATSHKGDEGEKAPKLPASDEANLRSLGFVWNAKDKRHEKKVNGGIVVKDPKTGRTTLVKTKK